jgi:hypothetical protein
MGILSSRNVAMVATARRSGGWQSIGAQLICRDSGFVQPIAEEIEDVGKSEQRELASRMAVLLAQLLKWQFQPERRASWQRTIKDQRRAIAAHIKETPSLQASLSNANWFEGVWADALAAAIHDTGLNLFPEDCPWPASEILAPDFYPA